jgi:hypothetical protein
VRALAHRRLRLQVDATVIRLSFVEQAAVAGEDAATIGPLLDDVASMGG